MLTLRRAGERGMGEHGWLSSRHTFSFADYRDPRHMSFRNLRVINEDYVMGGKGFGMHGHKNMEIISWVVSGKLTHRDTIGTEKTIGAGEAQYMSAGSGIRHSEFNGSDDEVVHLLQIWILPNEMEAEPRYQDTDFNEKLKSGELVLIASPDGRTGSIALRADALVYAARPHEGWSHTLPLSNERGIWVQQIKGRLEVNESTLEQGDGLAIQEESEIHIHALDDGEFLLFDLE